LNKAVIRIDKTSPVMLRAGNSQHVGLCAPFCMADYGRTWHHPQNRKCITYCSFVRERQQLS